MKKTWIIVILTCLILGVSSFFIFKGKNTNISVSSYDWEENFSLGEYNLKAYSSNIDGSEFSDPLTTFSFKSINDENSFLEAVTNLEQFVSVAEYHSNNSFGYTYYMFFLDGYYYVLYKNVMDDYVLTPMYAYYSMISNGDEESYRFVFPIYTSFNQESGVSNDLSITFDELVDFYELLDETEVIIDELNQTISLNAYYIFGLEKTHDFPIDIVWSNEGYTIIFNDTE